MAGQDPSFTVFRLIPVFLVILRAGPWPGLIRNLAETLGAFAFFTVAQSALVDALDEDPGAPGAGLAGAPDGAAPRHILVVYSDVARSADLPMS